jgi:hypothetical protein
MPVLDFKQAFANLQRSVAVLGRRALEQFGVIEPVQLAAQLSPQYPDLKALPEKTLYVVGGPGYQKWAYMVCPCGCGERIMLSLAKNRRPHWSVEIDWLGRPTIKPSVWQTDGCFSHFWVKKGRIEWTRDTGQPHRSRVGNEV